MGDSMTADDLIQSLNLAPHPEGGWYRETWRAPAEEGQRPASSAVYYVIRPGQRSHWNRVDADEIWLWHAGDPLEVSMSPGEAGPVTTIRLGGNVGAGEYPQLIIPKGHWQAADPVEGSAAGYTFISCIVAPAFEFSGFELAAPGWAPGQDSSAD
jgi:predicted cupin superfamily sugar epimerase